MQFDATSFALVEYVPQRSEHDTAKEYSLCGLPKCRATNDIHGHAS